MARVHGSGRVHGPWTRPVNTGVKTATFSSVQCSSDRMRCERDRAVATFEATEAAASVVFRTIASVKTILGLLRPFSHYVNLPVSTSITPSLFHSRLKTYLFHKPSGPRTDSTDFITDRLFSAPRFLTRDAAASAVLSVRPPACLSHA